VFSEKMHLTPIELYLFLLLIIPVGVCFWKWKSSSKWFLSTGACAGISWIYFNLWMMKLDPPDNGFANAVYIVTGWFWLLPIFAITWIFFSLIERRVSVERRQRIGEVGFMACALVTSIIVVWNFVGRMSEQRAITEARHQLQKRGLKPVVYSDGIRLTVGSFRWV
jgi:signal transduction histidine kinase